MNSQKKLFLLPYRCQIAGRIIALIGLLAWFVSLVMTAVHHDMETIQLFRWHLYSILILYVGLYLIGFSREKQEDEFTLHLRTSSALTAMLVIFGLKIILSFVLGFLQMKDLIAKDGIVKDLADSATSLTSIFFLYLIIYKIRRGRFNRESSHEE